MLIYHFGSREGLLAEVTREVEARQRAVMTATYDADLPPLEAAARYWEETVEATLRYGPLFFELAAHAMQGKEHAAALREELIAAWLPSGHRALPGDRHPRGPGRDPCAPRPGGRAGAAPRPARQRRARGGGPGGGPAQPAAAAVGRGRRHQPRLIRGAQVSWTRSGRLRVDAWPDPVHSRRAGWFFHSSKICFQARGTWFIAWVHDLGDRSTTTPLRPARPRGHPVLRFVASLAGALDRLAQVPVWSMTAGRAATGAGGTRHAAEPAQGARAAAVAARQSATTSAPTRARSAHRPGWRTRPDDHREPASRPAPRRQARRTVRGRPGRPSPPGSSTSRRPASSPPRSSHSPRSTTTCPPGPRSAQRRT